MGKTALLIIDMQKDFTLPGAPFYVDTGLRVLPKVREALAAFREAGLPVVHVFRYYRADGSDVEITRYAGFVEAGGGCVRGTEGAGILDEIAPIEGEYLIVKQRWSAFFRTELDNLLRRLGVDQVVLAGVQTPNCIRGTAWDANSLDYEVVVLEDATGAKTEEVHRANLFDMANIGIDIYPTTAFCSQLPDPPKHRYREAIQRDIEAGGIVPEPPEYR